MLSFEPNVVIIDDKPQEVKGIIDYYRNQGVGCKYFNSHLMYGDIKPVNCFSDVSLIFLDIYFSSNIYDYNPVFCADWVAAVIPEKTFYILVIWTTDKEKADEVLKELDRFNRSPFYCIIKWKKEYQEAEGYKFEELQKDIESELQKTPALSEIGIWKKNIKSASNRVIGGLTKDRNPEFFNMKLKKLIIGHGGTSLIRSTDVQRKRKVLFDALDRVLISNNNEMNKRSIISDDQLYNITPSEIKGEIDRELNSWFFFKLEKDISPNCILPGLISEFTDCDLQKDFNIRDDKKIEPKLICQKEENSLVINDIVVVLSRPCDVAQDKYGKNIKLLSGIKIKNPLRYKEANLTPKQKKNRSQYLNKLILTADLPDSCKLYDHLYFSEEEPDIALLFDFRYVFSVPRQIFIDKFKNLKIFNKELLSEIQVEYASYSSRLGITQLV